MYKRILKFFLYILIGLLSFIGIIFIVIILNYFLLTKNFSNNQTKNLIYFLPKKMTLELLKRIDESNENIFKSGEICFGINDKYFGGNKEAIFSSTKGIYYLSDGIYLVELNVVDNIIKKVSPIPWHWRWYNWFGFGLDNIMEYKVEDIVN